METISSTLQPAEFVSKFINQTNRNIFLTGKAGTGKTTLLHHIVSNTYKKCVVAAPTGIAAINAKGITLHSLFQLPFGSFIPVILAAKIHGDNGRVSDPVLLIKNLQMFDAKRKLLRELELLIIDEVSMLRADLLDAIDVILRSVRRRNNIPFGGVQILFIGDLLQLPPVVKDDEWQYLRPYYKSAYFFDSKVLQDNKPVYIELDKIYRQADGTFISLLNHLRDNELTAADYALLNNHYKPNFKSTPEDNYITLTTHNNKANELNKSFIERLAGKSYYYEAKIEGDFNDNSFPLEKTLELKNGAQIMFVKNDPTGQQRFFNGRLAIISSISDEHIEVTFADTNTTLKVEPYTWENIKYKVSGETNDIEETVVGKFIHYPIKLAWAITVHKSQGLTFDKAIIDIGSAFAPGQVYVALSRLRSLDGLVLTSQVNAGSISKDELISLYSKSQTEQQNLNTLLEEGTYLFIRNYILRCFDFAFMLELVREHADSYAKDDKKTLKKKYHEWAKELEKTITEIKPIADKFKNQINNILNNKEEGHLEFLHKRVTSAHEYFTPILKNISTVILKHIETIKLEKRIKSYVDDLLELELMVYEQLKLITKSTLIIESTILNKEVTAEDLKRIFVNTNRDEQLRMLSNTSVNNENGEPVIKKSKSRRDPSIPKKEKIDTKLETFKLYKLGKNVSDIAAERKVTVTTIEAHLAHYVAKGELKSEEFISKEKMDIIIATAKKLNTLFFGQIKSELGDAYTYSEIKFAIAGHLASEDKAE